MSKLRRKTMGQDKTKNLSTAMRILEKKTVFDDLLNKKPLNLKKKQERKTV